jgi:hypothetical protein
MKHTYRTLIASLPDYENVVAEIYVDEFYVGLLSSEEGLKQIKLELNGGAASNNLSVDLDTFEQALAHAKQRLSGAIV